MKKKLKFILFAFAVILILPCAFVFTGCKPKETGFYVVYNGVQIQGGTLNLSFDSTETIDIEGDIQAYVMLKKKADKKLDLSSLEISSNIKETISPGDEYQVEIKYKKFNAVKINIKINKLENLVSIQNSSKTYDGQPFTTEALGISATNDAGMRIEWFKGKTRLAEFPRNAGDYRVQVLIPETKTYKAVNKVIDVKILQAEPDVDWNLVSISETYLSTDTLSKIALPENFAWKNPETVLSVGTNNYTVVYTPADTNYKSVEKDFSVSANQAFFLPTQKEMQFTGEIIELKAENLIGFDVALMEIKDGQDFVLQTNAGTYNVKIGFKAGGSACWFDGTTEDKDFVWTISKAKVKVPYYKTNYALMPLTGPLTISWENAEEVFKFCCLYNGYNNTNTITFEKPVNTYLEFALKSQDNCEWEDGTTNNITQRIKVERDVFETIKYTPFGGTETIISTGEFLELKKTCVGSTFEFVLKDKTMVLKINEKVVKDGRFVVGSGENKVYVYVYEKENDISSLFSQGVEAYFYATSVIIDGKQEDITLYENDFDIDLKENQDSITVVLSNELENFDLSLVVVDHENAYKTYPINSLTVVVNNLKNVKMFVIQENKQVVSIVEVNINQFTRIESIYVNRINEYTEHEEQVYYQVDSDSSFSGIINRVTVNLKQGYQNLTIVLKDKNGNEFTDFSNLNGKEYFFIVVKDGENVLETVRVYYGFLDEVSFMGEKNTLKNQIDYYSFYVRVDDPSKLEEAAKGYNSKVKYVINKGNPVTFAAFGMYRVPISFTYSLYNNYTITYSTNLIVNYSKNIENFVENSSNIKFSSEYLRDGNTIYLRSNNYAGGCGLANFRAILTDGQYVENSIVPKEGYTLKKVSPVITKDKLFGYRVVFNNNGNEEVCYIYEAVSGIYDGNAEIDRVKIVSYFGEDRKCKIEDGKIYVENLKQLENLAIFTSNEESLVRIEDLEGKLIIASAQQSLDYVEAYFEAAGTYKMIVIAPDGTSKTYQIIVTGESLGKPFATVSAGKGAGKVTLEERFEELEDGDRDFNGDFIIDDSSENIIFNGYFGEAMLSEIKTIKGKEYLDVTISSVLIDNFYFDADHKNLINDGLNTLEVFETEDEQPVKYVRFYVAIELLGMKITIECNVFLADLQKAGE